MFRGRRRGRLVRHYFFISVILISGGLITSGLLEIYFRYWESWKQLASLQQEVAAAAAFKIERFVQEIERTMRGATKSRELALQGLTPDYKFELEKLLLIAPVVTEAIGLDAHGIIRVQASRLRISSDQANSDLPSSAAFQHTILGKSYFGPVYFVRGSEPYMTIAVPIERYAGEVIGVLQAEVNLKYIWEVVSGIKVGKAGYAYVVASSGDLIAHPNISFVLQRRNLARLQQVHTAFQSIPGATEQKALVTRNLQGKKVFSSFARIPSLDWAVILERPLEEAYEPLYFSMLRTSSLLLIGLGMALLASLFVAGRVVRPLRTLHEGVARIGSGNLSYRLDVKTGDEIEILADEFNKMTAQLQESYVNLEQKVEERTRELTESLEQQTTTAEVLQVMATSPANLKTVLDTILKSSLHLCQASLGSIFTFDGEAFHLAVITEPVTSKTDAYLNAPIRPGPETPLRRVALERRPIQSSDILNDPRFPAPEIYRIEGIRTTISVPLLKKNELSGAINIHRREVQPFTEREVELLTTFANQAVIAIENVHLFREIQEKNQQLETMNKHKSQFLANVSHELRTPLNAIIGFTRLVLRKTEGQIPELQKENLQKVLISSEHLLRLINDLLDLSKIEAGKMDVVPELFRVGEVIEVAASTVEPMLKDGRIRLTKVIAPGIPSLNTDRDKLKQILLNLLGNAAKFTEEGEIKISAWQENGTLKLVVSDTGIGIRKEALDHIFEEFRQADKSGTSSYGGTGLGLAIVRKFVNLLGGGISVDSEVGRGSTFIVTLPMDVKAVD